VPHLRGCGPAAEFGLGGRTALAPAKGCRFPCASTRRPSTSFRIIRNMQRTAKTNAPTVAMLFRERKSGGGTGESGDLRRGSPAAQSARGRGKRAQQGSWAGSSPSRHTAWIHSLHPPNRAPEAGRADPPPLRAPYRLSGPAAGSAGEEASHGGRTGPKCQRRAMPASASITTPV
jgi:hypothetical protein